MPKGDPARRPDIESGSFAGKNVVVWTTVLDLSGQLSNLREEGESAFSLRFPRLALGTLTRQNPESYLAVNVDDVRLYRASEVQWCVAVRLPAEVVMDPVRGVRSDVEEVEAGSPTCDRRPWGSPAVVLRVGWVHLLHTTTPFTLSTRASAMPEHTHDVARLRPSPAAAGRRVQFDRAEVLRGRRRVCFLVQVIGLMTMAPGSTTDSCPTVGASVF